MVCFADTFASASHRPMSNRLTPLSEDPAALWPSVEYDRQVEKLRAAIGERIYLVELRWNALHVSARFPGKAFELLDVVDFPRPDPSRRLFPHLLLLDDGRGVNLGSILRVSLEQAYSPLPENRLFCDDNLERALLFNERRLSHESIRRTARRQLGEILSHPHLSLPDAGGPEHDSG